MLISPPACNYPTTKAASVVSHQRREISAAEHSQCPLAAAAPWIHEHHHTATSPGLASSSRTLHTATSPAYPGCRNERRRVGATCGDQQMYANTTSRLYLALKVIVPGSAERFGTLPTRRSGAAKTAYIVPAPVNTAVPAVPALSCYLQRALAVASGPSPGRSKHCHAHVP